MNYWQLREVLKKSDRFVCEGLVTSKISSCDSTAGIFIGDIQISEEDSWGGSVMFKSFEGKRIKVTIEVLED